MAPLPGLITGLTSLCTNASTTLWVLDPIISPDYIYPHSPTKQFHALSVNISKASAVKKQEQNSNIVDLEAIN